MKDTFDKKFIKELSEEVSNAIKGPVSPRLDYGGRLFLENNEGTLDLMIRPKDLRGAVTIARIIVPVERVGTGTLIVKHLEEYVKSKGLTYVRVESVIGEGATEFCKKLGYIEEPGGWGFAPNFIKELT
jgi:hypothetical protein